MTASLVPPVRRRAWTCPVKAVSEPVDRSSGMPRPGGTLYRRTPERVFADPIHGPRSQPLSLRANQCREADLAGRCAVAPDKQSGAFVCAGSAGRVGAARAVAAPAWQTAVVDRVVEIDVAQSTAEQLECVAGQRVGVLLVDAELLGHSAGPFGEPEGHDGGCALGRR